MLYHDILLFAHFIGLAMGIGVGITNMVIARMIGAAATPDAASALRSLPPILSRISMAGLVVLVISGLLLLFYWGFAITDFWFWLKILGVAGMIGVAYLMYQAQEKIRAGDQTAAAQMRQLGPAMGGLGLLVTLLSVFSFH
ncbi:MAG: hypothetical protein IT534_04190 [Bauldia sp.]|nr:hypothetical protein [Bauldia sp.]